MIRITYPNLLHGCDFFCFGSWIINEFEKVEIIFNPCQLVWWQILVFHLPNNVTPLQFLCKLTFQSLALLVAVLFYILLRRKKRKWFAGNLLNSNNYYFWTVYYMLVMLPILICVLRQIEKKNKMANYSKENLYLEVLINTIWSLCFHFQIWLVCYGKLYCYLSFCKTEWSWTNICRGKSNFGEYWVT